MHPEAPQVSPVGKVEEGYRFVFEACHEDIVNHRQRVTFPCGAPDIDAVQRLITGRLPHHRRAIGSARDGPPLGKCKDTLNRCVMVHDAFDPMTGKVGARRVGQILGQIAVERAGGDHGYVGDLFVAEKRADFGKTDENRHVGGVFLEHRGQQIPRLEEVLEVRRRPLPSEQRKSPLAARRQCIAIGRRHRGQRLHGAERVIEQQSEAGP